MTSSSRSVDHGAGPSFNCAGVTSGGWSPASSVKAPSTVDACGRRATRAADCDRTVCDDMLIERLAELRVVDLVLEVVERDEVERVAQRRAAHRRTDLDDRGDFAVACRIDADRRRARCRIRGDDASLDLHRRRSRARCPPSRDSRICGRPRRDSSARAPRPPADGPALAVEIGNDLRVPDRVDHRVGIEAAAVRLRSRAGGAASASRRSCSRTSARLDGDDGRARPESAF